MLKVTIRIKMETDHYGYDFWLVHTPFTARCLHLASLGNPILTISDSNSLQKSPAVQKISGILSLAIIAILIVSYWCSTIRLQKYNEITNFFEYYSYPEFRLIANSSISIFSTPFIEGGQWWQKKKNNQQNLLIYRLLLVTLHPKWGLYPHKRVFSHKV